MSAMRELWTDERLDDMSARVTEGFARLETDLREHRSETRAEFMALRSEIGTTQRLMVQIGGGMIGTMVLGFASLLLTHT